MNKKDGREKIECKYIADTNIRKSIKKQTTKLMGKLSTHLSFFRNSSFNLSLRDCHGCSHQTDIGKPLLHYCAIRYNII